MSVTECKNCGAVISATSVEEWNNIPIEQKASSSSLTRRFGQCQKCYNENNGRTMR